MSDQFKRCYKVGTLSQTNRPFQDWDWVGKNYDDVLVAADYKLGADKETSGPTKCANRSSSRPAKK